MAEAQPGWYPDPAGDPTNPTQLRWWDGTQWTENYAPAQPQQPQPSAYTQTTYTQTTYGTPATPAGYYMSDTDRNLRLAAFVLNVLSTVGTCWLIVPLAWMVPMTVHSWRLYQGEKPNTTGFAVCDLIFCSVIAGVLLLISQKDA